MQPPLITRKLVEVAIEHARVKKKLSSIDKLEFNSFTEGKSAQTRHVGLFSEERLTVEKIHHFIHENGRA